MLRKTTFSFVFDDHLTRSSSVTIIIRQRLKDIPQLNSHTHTHAHTHTHTHTHTSHGVNSATKSGNVTICEIKAKILKSILCMSLLIMYVTTIQCQNLTGQELTEDYIYNNCFHLYISRDLEIRSTQKIQKILEFYKMPTLKNFHSQPGGLTVNKLQSSLHRHFM